MLRGGDAMAVIFAAVACFLQAISVAIELIGWLESRKRKQKPPSLDD
jgi:hypothetical protein